MKYTRKMKGVYKYEKFIRMVTGKYNWATVYYRQTIPFPTIYEYFICIVNIKITQHWWKLYVILQIPDAAYLKLLATFTLLMRF